uniref:Vezatin n=1 Tax=Lygus hesperus TaxID=30085 RepID=A0A146MC43_LYGHE
MLDEDISFLVNECPDHQERTYLGRLDHILLPGCCLTLMISSYRLVKNLKWSILLFLSSIGPTVFIAYKLFQVSRVKKEMEELLVEMKSLTRFVKKTTKSIKETMTVVHTRLILSSFRKMNPELMDRYYLQVKVDIDNNSHTFMKFLLEIISITREATNLIISTEAFTNCSKSFFLASCTNEELGFPTLNDDCVVGVSITKLEELCIEYLVMQSEYLRALGMWLCSPVHNNPDGVSSKMLVYKESISQKHKMAQQVFTGALFTRYLERTNLPIHGSTDIVITKMNSALTALMIEALSLKSSLSEIGHSDISCFEFGLSNLESCISDCTEIFKEVRSYYSRRQKWDDNNQESSKCPLGPENASSARKTGVEVGYTDFSVSGEDKVYLCITDVNESMENLNDESTFMDESPKYPNTLLHELRSVLEEKRIEFKQRESNAIKNSDLEAVENQFDLVLLNNPMEKGAEQPPAEQDDKQTKSNSSQKLVPSIHPPQFEDSQLVSDVSDFSLSKSIAATAAKTSATWNCQNEEFFGDDDNDDD